MLVKLNKGGTFAPATNAYVPYRYCKTHEPIRKIYFQKRIKKVCGNRKRMLHLHPAKTGKFIEKLMRFQKRVKENLFSKKLFKKLAR